MANGTSNNGDRKFSLSDLSKAWDGLKSFGSVFGTIIVMAISCSSFVWSYSAEINSRFEAIERNHEADIKTLTVRIDQLERSVAEHNALGVLGVPHPQGVIVEIANVRREIDDKTRDRFSKQDFQKWQLEKYSQDIRLLENRLNKLEPK